MINLDNLPEPDVLKIPSYDELLAENVALLTSLLPDYEPLASDPYMLLLDAFAYRELHLRQAFNNKLKNTLLPYATGSDLSALAVEYGVERLGEGDNQENDEAFRRRILMSFDGYSTAGSVESYEFHAFSVSSDVWKAKAYSPEKGVVNVMIAHKDWSALVMDEDNEDADHEALFLALIANKLNEDKVRPLTDTVHVLKAQEKQHTVKATIELHDTDERKVEQIKQRIDSNFQTMDLNIGDDLPLSQIIKNLHELGVYKVTLDKMEGIHCDDKEIIRINELDLTFVEASYE